MEMEKDKKVRMEFHVRHDAALVILDCLHHELDGSVAGLTNKELLPPLYKLSIVIDLYCIFYQLYLYSSSCASINRDGTLKLRM